MQKLSCFSRIFPSFNSLKSILTVGYSACSEYITKNWHHSFYISNNFFYWSVARCPISFYHQTQVVGHHVTPYILSKWRPDPLTSSNPPISGQVASSNMLGGKYGCGHGPIHTHAAFIKLQPIKPLGLLKGFKFETICFAFVVIHVIRVSCVAADINLNNQL